MAAQNDPPDQYRQMSDVVYSDIFDPYFDENTDLSKHIIYYGNPDDVVYKYILNVGNNIYDNNNNLFMSGKNKKTFSFAILPPFKMKIFRTYNLGDPKDIDTVMDSCQHGQYKTFYCDLCSINEQNYIFYKEKTSENPSEFNMYPIKKDARLFQLITVDNIQFSITPTTLRYYENHCLLLPVEHISSRLLISSENHFKAIYKMLLPSDSSSLIHNGTKGIFNGKMGSNIYHGHLHLTNQNLAVIDDSLQYIINNSDQNNFNSETYKILFYKNLDELFIQSRPYINLYTKLKDANPITHHISYIFYNVRDKTNQTIYCLFIQIINVNIYNQIRDSARYTNIHVIIPSRIVNMRGYNMKQINAENVDYVDKFLNYLLTGYISSDKIDEIAQYYLPEQYLLSEYDAFEQTLYTAYKFETICKRISTTNLRPYLYEKNIEFFKLYITHLMICRPDINIKNIRIIQNFLLEHEYNDLSDIVNQNTDMTYLFDALYSIINISSYIPNAIIIHKEHVIGHPSAFGIVSKATIKNNNVIIKIQQSGKIATYEAVIGQKINLLARKNPHFVYTFGLIDCRCSEQFSQFRDKLGNILLNAIRSDNQGKKEEAAAYYYRYSQHFDKFKLCSRGKKYDNEMDDGIGDVYSSALLIQQHINGISFTDMMIDRKYSFLQLITVLKQLFISLEQAQYQLQYTHYDLHFRNIIVQKVPENVYKYKFDDTIYIINNNSVNVSIIDYGANHVSGVNYEFDENDKIRLDLGRTTNEFRKYFDFYTIIINFILYVFKYRNEDYVKYNQLLQELIAPFNNIYNNDFIGIIDKNKDNVMKYHNNYDPDDRKNNSYFRKYFNNEYKQKRKYHTQYVMYLDYNEEKMLNVSINYFRAALDRYFPNGNYNLSEIQDVCLWGNKFAYNNGCYVKKLKDEHKIETAQTDILKIELAQFVQLF